MRPEIVYASGVAKPSRRLRRMIGAIRGLGDPAAPDIERAQRQQEMEEALAATLDKALELNLRDGQVDLRGAAAFVLGAMQRELLMRADDPAPKPLGVGLLAGPGVDVVSRALHESGAVESLARLLHVAIAEATADGRVDLRAAARYVIGSLARAQEPPR